MPLTHYLEIGKITETAKNTGHVKALCGTYISVADMKHKASSMITCVSCQRCNEVFRENIKNMRPK